MDCTDDRRLSTFLVQTIYVLEPAEELDIKAIALDAQACEQFLASFRTLNTGSSPQQQTQRDATAPVPVAISVAATYAPDDSARSADAAACVHPPRNTMVAVFPIVANTEANGAAVGGGGGETSPVSPRPTKKSRVAAETLASASATAGQYHLATHHRAFRPPLTFRGPATVELHLRLLLRSPASGAVTSVPITRPPPAGAASTGRVMLDDDDASSSASSSPVHGLIAVTVVGQHNYYRPPPSDADHTAHADDEDDDPLRRRAVDKCIAPVERVWRPLLVRRWYTVRPSVRQVQLRFAQIPRDERRALHDVALQVAAAAKHAGTVHEARAVSACGEYVLWPDGTESPAKELEPFRRVYTARGADQPVPILKHPQPHSDVLGYVPAGTERTAIAMVTDPHSGVPYVLWEPTPGEMTAAASVVDTPQPTSDAGGASTPSSPTAGTKRARPAAAKDEAPLLVPADAPSAPLPRLLYPPGVGSGWSPLQTAAQQPLLVERRLQSCVVFPTARYFVSARQDRGVRIRAAPSLEAKQTGVMDPNELKQAVAAHVGHNGALFLEWAATATSPGFDGLDKALSGAALCESEAAAAASGAASGSTNVPSGGFSCMDSARCPFLVEVFPFSRRLPTLRARRAPSPADEIIDLDALKRAKDAAATSNGTSSRRRQRGDDDNDSTDDEAPGPDETLIDGNQLPDGLRAQMLAGTIPLHDLPAFDMGRSRGRRAQGRGGDNDESEFVCSDDSGEDDDDDASDDEDWSEEDATDDDDDDNASYGDEEEASDDAGGSSWADEDDGEGDFEECDTDDMDYDSDE